jgi:signal transduction histidine kinase
LLIIPTVKPKHSTSLHSRLFRNPAFYLFIFLVPGLLVPGLFLFENRELRIEAQSKALLSQELAGIRAELENRILSTIFTAESINAVLTLNPQLTQDDFSLVISPFFRERPYLRNIVLAPDLVIQYVYPFQENQQIIGVDYRDLPDQYPSVALARNLNQTVIAGPLELLQGGKALIARVPIFLDQSVQTTTRIEHTRNQETIAIHPRGGRWFWGIASLVIDLEALFVDLGIGKHHDRFQISIRGTDGTGRDGPVFFGDPLVFDQEPVTTDVFLTLGSWQIGAIAHDGFQPEEPFLELLYVPVALALLIFAFILILLIEKLHQARELALEASKAKSNFLAAVSHEIRTPLNGIMGFLSLMEQSQLPEEEQQYVKAMEVSSKKLLYLVNDILDFAQIESGKQALDIHKADLREVIDHLLMNITIQAREKELELDHHIDPEIPRFMLFDPLRLEQVLANLLTNAIKFTHQGRVQLNIQLINSEHRGNGTSQCLVRFSVQDTGIGIAPEAQEQIFDPFYQVDGGNSRKYQGIGLGLSLCASFIKAMNSKLQLVSTPGEGSVFFFELLLDSVPELI